VTVSATEDLGAKAADMAAMLVHDYGLRAFQYALIDGEHGSLGKLRSLRQHRASRSH